MASQSFRLVMQTGPSLGKTFEISKDEMTIGRDVATHIVINDPEVSRKHAHITVQTDGCLIEDLGSTNGTFVNGQRLIGPHMLRSGEMISLGEKVSMEYLVIGYDPDATLVSAPSAKESQQVSPQPETFRVAESPEDSIAPLPQPVPLPPAPKQTVVVPPVPEFQPAFSGQVPPGPDEPEPYNPVAEPLVESYDMRVPFEEEEQKSRTWIYVGCGCLIVLLCLCVAGAYAFDALNLYCETPFRSITELLGAQCP